MADEDAAEEAWKIIEKAHVCFFTTQDGDGLHARPMGIFPRREEQAIYLLTSADAHTDLSSDSSAPVSLTFAEDTRYLALSGDATISENREKIREIWSTAAEAWWDGPDDPDIRLITVRPHEAHYWKTPGKLAAAVAMAAAAATGKRPPAIGKDRTTRLS